MPEEPYQQADYTAVNDGVTGESPDSNTSQERRQSEAVPYDRFKSVNEEANRARQEAEYYKSVALANQTSVQASPEEAPVAEREPEESEYNDLGSFTKDTSRHVARQEISAAMAARDRADEIRSKENSESNLVMQAMGAYPDLDPTVLAPVITPGTPAYKYLFSKDAKSFGSMASHLAKNPSEAKRIASIKDESKQYEEIVKVNLKLNTAQNIGSKETKQRPLGVTRPGQGMPASVGSPSSQRLFDRAKTSKSTWDWAKYIESSKD